MARTIFNRPDLPRSNSPISNAVRIGNLIFVSGFPGYDANVQVAKGDFAAKCANTQEFDSYARIRG